jgi:hypothetical protein
LARDRLLILPPKARVVLAPSTDTTPEVPRVIIPDDPTQPPVYIPGPVKPPPPPADDSLVVIDIRNQLPRDDNNGPFGRALKTLGLTYHWLGADYSRVASDSESVAYLIRVAYDHIRKDWSTDGSGAFGNTIMYHEAISPLGTIIILRDYEEIAWHAGNEAANTSTRAILVMCGPNTPPTPAQTRAVRMRWEDFGRSQIRGHQEWSSTACPGPQLMEQIRQIRA